MKRLAGATSSPLMHKPRTHRLILAAALVWLIVPVQTEAGNIEPTKNKYADELKSSKLTPKVRYLMHKTVQLTALEQYDAAIKFVTKALESEPKELHLLGLRAEIFALQEKYGKAIEDYDRMISIKPTGFEAFGYRGKIYEKTGDDKKALSDYNKMISLGGRYHDIRGRLYMRHGQWQNALADLTAALKEAETENIMSVYTDRASVYDKLGKSELAAQDRKKAQEILSELLGSNVDTYPEFVPKNKAK